MTDDLKRQLGILDAQEEEPEPQLEIDPPPPDPPEKKGFLSRLFGS